MAQRMVLAVGGNALIASPDHKTVSDQYHTCLNTTRQILPLLEQGHQLILTHGNGPQVGFILRRSELAASELHEVPLDACVADTQGAIGYQFQRALYSLSQGQFRAVTVVTQVLVQADDPAFNHPSKPIGAFMTREQALLRKSEGWHVMEDAGRGWRRVVPSPKPVDIVELQAIQTLSEQPHTLVIAAGGGGIPVSRQDNGSLLGLEAVIDKDLASSLLARKINADLLVISTAVSHAYLYFGTPKQRAIENMSLEQAMQYVKEGHFKPGSMLPKIQAMIDFVKATRKPAILCHVDELSQAIEGHRGTRILP